MENAHDSMRDMIDVVGSDGDVPVVLPDEPAIPAMKSRIPLDEPGGTSCPAEQLAGFVDTLRGMDSESIPEDKMLQLRDLINTISSAMGSKNGDEVIEEDGELSLDNMAPSKDQAGRPQHNRSDGQSFQQKNGWLG